MAQLVADGTRHAIDRYGVEIVKNWYFEVWNEPNLENAFLEGSQGDFFRLWAETYRAVKEVDASLRVGGPSAARGDWVLDLVDFGRKNNCEPDYIITHVYNNDSEWAALSPFDGPQEDKASKSPHFAAGVMRGVRRELDARGFKGEVHWNEWGRSWLPYDPIRETANEAAFVVKTMSEVSQLADCYALLVPLRCIRPARLWTRNLSWQLRPCSIFRACASPAYHAFPVAEPAGRRSASCFRQRTRRTDGAPSQRARLKAMACSVYSFDEAYEAGARMCQARVTLPEGATQNRCSCIASTAAKTTCPDTVA
jgi:hypothetical protein